MPTLSLDPNLYRKSLALRDLTDAAWGPHAMQQIVSTVIAELAHAWSCATIVYRYSPVVTIADNYELLNFPADAVTRDKRYTRYVTDKLMLRSHSSALIPGLLRDIARAPYPDVLLACPGLVYRRDSIDRIHVGEPHHMDLWRITDRPMQEADLEEMIRVAVEAAVPGAQIRTRPSPHPYTQGGREVEVQAGDFVGRSGRMRIGPPPRSRNCRSEC